MNTIEHFHGTLRTTTDPTRAHGKLRSIGAVLGGLATTVAFTTAVDTVFHAAGVFPPMGERMSGALFVLALAYRIPFNIAGTYLAARLAPSNPTRHAMALGVLGLAIGSLGAILMWDFGPGWYSIANIAIALPCGWAGGLLLARSGSR